MDEPEELTPAVAQARRRRVDLHNALVEVEEAISAPAPGRVKQWAENVAAHIVHLRTSFDDHIRGTEEPGGLYDDILERAPHLSGKVKRLRDEHPMIQLSIAKELQRTSEDLPETDEAIDELRDDIQRLLGKITHHREHGADLMWEAYNLDIGGAG
jgi:predicted  nucleic acid-binding Zn-ribbon protein